MGGVAEGFATVGALIFLGVFVAHIGLFDMTAQRILARLSFSVATPALLIVVLQDADISVILSPTLLGGVVSVGVVAGLYVVLSRLLFKQSVADTTLGAVCATYMNAGNLGLPIAAYVLGDAALAAPFMLLQLLIVHPVVLTLLDTTVAERRLQWWRVALRPVQNPLMVATIIGLTLSLTDTRLPSVVFEPLSQVAAIAIPSILIAFGISLRWGPRPGTDASTKVLTTITVLKLIVQPLVACLVALAVGASSEIVLTVTVLAALPTGQNVFVFAARYGSGLAMTRDATFITTVLSVPVIAVIVLLLG